MCHTFMCPPNVQISHRVLPALSQIIVLQATDAVVRSVYIPAGIWLHIRTFCYSLLLTLGNSTGLSAEGITGRVLLILTEIILLLVWALLFAVLVHICCKDGGSGGNLLSLHLTICDLLFAVL